MRSKDGKHNCYFGLQDLVYFSILKQKKKISAKGNFGKQIPPTILVRESQKYEPCWKFPEAE